jgi:hypothetical protein
MRAVARQTSSAAELLFLIEIFNYMEAGFIYACRTILMGKNDSVTIIEILNYLEVGFIYA